MVLLVIPGSKGSHFTAAIKSMKFVFIIQYLPRVFRVQSFLKKVRWSSGIFLNTTGIKAIFNLFLYVLASHVSSFPIFLYLAVLSACIQSFHATWAAVEKLYRKKWDWQEMRLENFLDIFFFCLYLSIISTSLFGRFRSLEPFGTCFPLSAKQLACK